MTNEIIGIASTIGLIFLLFVLRRFILPSERKHKRRHVAFISPRETHEPDKRAIDDNAWPLWTPSVENEIRVARGQSHEPREALRRGREDRTLGGEIR